MFNDYFPNDLEHELYTIAHKLCSDKIMKDDLVSEAKIAILELDGNYNKSYCRDAGKYAMQKYLEKERQNGMTFIPQIKKENGKWNTHKKIPVRLESLETLSECEDTSNDEWT